MFVCSDTEDPLPMKREDLSLTPGFSLIQLNILFMLPICSVNHFIHTSLPG